MNHRTNCFVMLIALLFLPVVAHSQIKISSLPETTTPSSSDVLPIVSGGVTKKVTVSNLLGVGPSGTVTTTGSPTNGNLTKFSGANSITNADLTGDVTTSGGLATSIVNNVITYAKMQDVSAGSRLLGRGDSGAGDPEEITLGSGLTMAGTTLSATGGGTVTTTGSPADGNLTKFSGASSITNANLTGDVTTSDGLATTIASDAVTYGKMQNVSAASKLLGRGDSGSGDPQEITLGSGLAISGTTLSVTAVPTTFASGAFDQYRMIGVNARPNAGAHDTFGHSAITPYGDNTTVNGDDADGAFRRLDTASSSGTTAGFSFNNGGLVQTRWLPQIITKLKTDSTITSMRLWVGCFTVGAPSSDDPTVHGFGFRFSTNAGDTTWHPWTNDSSGGGTITDSGVTFSASQVYSLAVVVENASSIKFYISTDNGASYSLVATHTTNLPNSSQGMDCMADIRNLTAAVRSFKHGYTYIRMR